MQPVVVMTGAAGSLVGLSDAVAALGGVLIERPLLAFAPPLSWAELDSALDQIESYQAMVVTSPRAAAAVRSRWAGRGFARAPRVAVWASGAATAAALDDSFGTPHVIPDRTLGARGAGRAVATALLTAGVAGRVLFPCGDHHRAELPMALRGAGLEVDEVICYRSLLAEVATARAALEGTTVAIVTSPRVAEVVVRALEAGGGPALLAIGPTTGAAFSAAGRSAGAVAAEPSVRAVTEALGRLLSTQS